MILKGKVDSKGTWREVKLDGDNNLNELIRESLDYSNRLSRYYMEKQIDSEAKKPRRLILKGTGLKALSKPWVTSNIEEVYFDWTLLMSETYRNAGIGCDELLDRLQSGKRGYIKSGIPLKMFNIANTEGVNNIRTRYPRLRCIGLISNLSYILSKDFDRGKTGIDSLEDSIKLWSKMDRNIELIKQSNSLIVMNELDDIKGYNINFSIRDGIYKFDKEVLNGHFNNYKDF